MKRVLWVVLAAASLGAPSLGSAAMIGVAGRVSTLGLGVEAAMPVAPFIGVRGGLYGFSYPYDAKHSGNDYEFDLKLLSGALLADLKPPVFPLRATIGLIANGNELDAKAKPGSAASYQIGGQTYTAADVGQFKGKVQFNSVAPYAGLGWGSVSGFGLGVVVDIGVMLQGSPKVSMGTTQTLPDASAQQQLEADLAQEEGELEDDLKSFRFYPVVSLGVRFGF